MKGDRKYLLIPANHSCQCNGKSIQEAVDNTVVSKTKHSKEKINVWSGDLRYKIYKKEPFSLAWVLAIIILDLFIYFAEIKTKALYSSWIIKINTV